LNLASYPTRLLSAIICSYEEVTWQIFAHRMGLQDCNSDFVFCVEGDQEI